MKFIGNIQGLIKKPFPINEKPNGYLIDNIYVSLFVFVFLFLFRPFGIGSLQNITLFVCLGFGIITYITSILFDITIGKVLKIKRDNERYNLGRWMVEMLVVMFFISLSNFIYVGVLIGAIQWEYFPSMLYGTFLVGFIPVVFIGTLTMLRQESNNKHIADSVGQSQQVSNTNSEKNVFDIPLRQIKYVESWQNYVKICYIDGNAVYKERTERATLKSVLFEITGSSIVQCHRSFLVNKDAIESANGNAQGLMLKLYGCEKKIPVSRSFISSFKI